MRKLRDILLKIVNIISIAIIICTIFVLISVVFLGKDEVPDFMGYSIFRITTGSMEPTLKTGSLIVVHKTDISQIKPDDVITFYSRDPALEGAVNTHRVVEITEENGQAVIVTKGDANYVNDKYLVYSDDLIGVMIYDSYVLGVIIRLVSNPLIFLPLIFLPLLVMLILNLTKTVKMMGKMMDEEDSQTALEKKDALPEENTEEKSE